MSACYGSGVDTGDVQIHMVLVKASEVYDLRWRQIHDNLHKAERAEETQGRIYEQFLKKSKRD